MADTLSPRRSPVRAAGGLVWRPGAAEGVEVLVVHRPKYDDWSLPKGKLDPGETPDAGALREVEEETGLRCRLGQELGVTTHVDHRGRPKEVRWWAMEVSSGSFEPNGEVDEVRWLGLGEAARLLSHDRDRVVIGSFLARR
jgi:8-oxo-dGTP pyrophosphatase MutT (NUDIX family)